MRIKKSIYTQTEFIFEKFNIVLSLFSSTYKSLFPKINTHWVYLKLVFIGTCFFVPITGFTQIKLDSLASIKVTADYFSTDKLGFIYTINNTQAIKYKPDSSLFYKYNGNQFGSLSNFDTFNPLKILIFSQDYARISFLDNTMTADIKNIALEDFDLAQITLACTSINDGMWLYDQSLMQLIRYSEQMQVIEKTSNIFNLLQHEINPTFMVEYANKVYLTDPDLGIYVFDIYGGYVRMIPIKGIHRFQALHNKILYNISDSIYIFDLILNTENKLPVHIKEVNQVRLEKNILFVFNQNRVTSYRINP